MRLYFDLQLKIFQGNNVFWELIKFERNVNEFKFVGLVFMQVISFIKKK